MSERDDVGVLPLAGVPPPGGEQTILALATQLEQLRPWLLVAPDLDQSAG